MTKILKSLATAAIMVGLTAGFAHAHANGKNYKCDVAKNERQSTKTLKTKLKKEGLKVHRIKIEGGCYEAYVMGKDGKEEEIFYDPKTLEIVGK